MDCRRAAAAALGDVVLRTHGAGKRCQRHHKIAWSASRRRSPTLRKSGAPKPAKPLNQLTKFRFNQRYAGTHDPLAKGCGAAGTIKAVGVHWAPRQSKEHSNE
jgi:hypothetical protein